LPEPFHPLNNIAELIINDDFLRLLGYYLAEGNKQKSYIILANSSDKIREEIETAIRGLGIPFSLRPSGEHQISSTPLALLLSNICGSKSCVKKLPYFWPQLSNEQLGTLLRAYFDGDGGVERAGAVTCITASPRLASDLLYALMRFGIWARVRKVWKRATNSDHKGGWYWLVTISGQRNLQAFNEKIGFGLLNKTNALKEKLKHHAHSNVDLIPGCGLDLKRLREGLGLSKKRLAKMAGLSRSAIYLFEIGKRNPRRETVEKLLRVFEEAAAHREITTELKELLSNLRNLLSCRWTKVKEVEAIPYNKPFVYDVSVADNETFLSGFGGMFVHNTYVMANIIEKWQRPTLVICHNKTLAAQLYSEFREFFPLNAVEYFVSYYDFYQPEAYVPEYDLYIEKDASINEEIDRLRLAATSSLMSRRDVIIVASVSCIYGIGSPEDYGRVVVNLRKGEVRKRNKVLRHLVDIYYERNDFDFARGRFRVRGDTLEVFPAYGETAYRIEFWGDEIERITEVNPLTGEVLSERMSIAIYPAKLFVTPQEKLELALRDIEAELEERLKELHSQGKLLEAQRLEQRTRYDLEMLREIGYCPGVENYSRHLSRRKPGEPPWTLLDYFPDDFLMFIDESHMTIPQLHGMYRGDRSRKETLVEYGFRLPSALDNRPLKFEEFESRINQVIYTSATPGPYELKHSTQVVEQIIRPTGLVDPEVIVKPTEGQIDDLLWQIDQRVNKGERVLVTTLTKRMAEDLADYLEEMGVKVHYLHSEIQTIERVEILRDLRLGVYDVVVGINLLREGLDLPEVSLVAILDADKEGFLRSETALIQTIGRAARHINGQVIMYADTITKSMQRAIEETNRRRRIQMEYNEKHGIEPKSIVKEIHDLTDRVRRMREERATYRFELPKHEVKRLIEDLEKQMKEAASRLEFEKAAMLRDKIFELKKMELSSGEFFNRSQEDLR
jgi:excinuclease ABC subunit B